MKRPFFLYLLFVVHIFLGLGAIYGGGSFVIKPDGSLLSMDLTWLENTPFNSYFIPGFILLTLIGILPILTCIGLFLKPQWKWANRLNMYKNMHWAWAFSLYSGVIVIIWIIIQQVMTHYFWLQPAMISTGLLIIIFTITPSVIKHFEIVKESKKFNYE